MSETIVTFQSQLSGVMETVFKAAMYEITRLVEDSFLEEVTRSREQVESLKRRLKWSESRRKERDREGDRRGRCVDCGRIGVSSEDGEERSSSVQSGTDKGRDLKQERIPKQEKIGVVTEEGVVAEQHVEEASSGTNGQMKVLQPPDVENEKLDGLLKEEELHASELPGGWSLSEEGVEDAGLSGPSKDFSEQELQACQEEWEAGLEPRAEPGLDGDAMDPAAQLYRTRYGMEELGGYATGHILDMGGLDGLQESPSHLDEELGYMNHYQGDMGPSEGPPHRPPPPGLHRMRRGPDSSSGSPSGGPVDVGGEFSCLLINEEGYLQDPSALYPEHPAGESGSRAHRGHGPPAREGSLDPAEGVYGSADAYGRALGLQDRLQHPAGARGGRRHVCSQCSMAFPDSASLRAHRQTHKVGSGPPYSCNQCGKTFTQACNLKVHQRIHSGQGLHLCSHCGKGFPSFSELKTHKCSQTGDKPYCCSVCGNKFSRLWNLKLHRRIHTQEKPHQCTMCEKSFTRADILKVHQRTHTGERPYCCAICGLSFKRLDHLKSHQRKHRPDQTN